MEQKPLNRLRCVVERITYQSDGYSVLKCAAKGYADLVREYVENGLKTRKAGGEIEND